MNGRSLKLGLFLAAALAVLAALVWVRIEGAYWDARWSEFVTSTQATVERARGTQDEARDVLAWESDLGGNLPLAAAVQLQVDEVDRLAESLEPILVYLIVEDLPKEGALAAALDPLFQGAGSGGHQSVLFPSNYRELLAKYQTPSADLKEVTDSLRSDTDKLRGDVREAQREDTLEAGDAG